MSRRSSLPLDISAEIRSGNVLAGDDLDADQLRLWFAQEQEAFYEDDAGNSDVDPWYAHMRRVNHRLGFDLIEPHLPRQGAIFMVGPGSGVELDEFARAHPSWVPHFLEASQNFRRTLLAKWPRSVIVEPETSGRIALPSDSQDVVCAFSVLHHIPNVSFVLTELGRVTRPGGFLLVREPCSSMGDWRYPRSTTPNERGISRHLLLSMARRAGFVVWRRPIPILFEPINRVLKKTIGFAGLPFGLVHGFDSVVSGVLALNDHYWRDSFYKKLGPSSYFYVLRKSAESASSHAR